MKKTLNFAKTISFVFALSLLVFSLQTFAQTSFNPSIVITGNTEIFVGETTQLTATWKTGLTEDSGPNVNRQFWYVDGAFVQNGNPDLDANDGESNYTFGAPYNATASTYNVCFKFYHTTGGPTPTIRREYQVCQDIVVKEPVVETGCPAAPAIANEYLDSIGYEGDRGTIISAVTDEMKPGNDFQGNKKCLEGDLPNPVYRAAVITFVQGQLPPAFASLFEWFLR